MRTHDRVHRLERLLEVSRTLSTTLEPQAVLKAVIQAAMELTKSEAASILLYDEESNQLHFAAATPGHWERLKDQAVPLRGSIAGKALAQRKPIIEANVARSPQHFQQVDHALRFTTRNLIAVPLLLERRPLGVLEALNKPGGFTAEDADTLQTLAAHAAIALHNARLMKEARQAYEELQKVDQMKSDFIAIASHELRTPLGIILGYATHLQEVLDEPYKGPMQTLTRAALRLKDIVEELSQIENYQQGRTVLRLQRIDLNALLQEVVAAFQPQAAERHIRLELHLPQTSTPAKVEPEKIRVLLRHLLRNALTFTDPGGRVEVALQPLQDYLQILVTDTGIGIPAQDLRRIFERFYQVEKHLTRRHGGLGLGLAIAKAMAEAHGGTIWAESEEGKGTTMVVVLPRNPSQASPMQHILQV